MKGKIRRDIPSTIDGNFFFRKDEIVECGYHNQEGELSEVRGDYIWAQNFGSNPANSLDFLTADEVEVLED